MKKAEILVVCMILLLPSVAFSDSTQSLSFQFRIDKSAPISTDYNSNTSIVNNIDESVLFYSFWEDTYEGLDNYYFEWNITGTFENSSATGFDVGWSNITKTINNASAEGYEIFYRFHAKDVNNNWATTKLKSINLISAEPEYNQLIQNNSNPTAGDIVELSCYWSDNFNIYSAILQTDYSGEWLDNQTIIINNKLGWSNFTWDTTGYSGETINCRMIGFDNVSNSNTTIQKNFTVI